jgi:hypothetical protein
MRQTPELGRTHARARTRTHAHAQSAQVGGATREREVGGGLRWGGMEWRLRGGGRCTEGEGLRTHACTCTQARASKCVCSCVRACLCMRACVRACTCARVSVRVCACAARVRECGWMNPPPRPPPLAEYTTGSFSCARLTPEVYSTKGERLFRRETGTRGGCRCTRPAGGLGLGRACVRPCRYVQRPRQPMPMWEGCCGMCMLRGRPRRGVQAACCSVQEINECGTAASCWIQGDG